MGARGPLPKDDAKRSSSREPKHETIVLGSSPADVDAPKIPRREWQKLHAQTRAWWNAWLKAEQASQFVGTDWTRLRGVMLPLVEAFHRAIEAGEVKVAKELAAELRMQEQDFGATPAARRRAGWIIRKPGDTTPEKDAAPRRPTAVQGDPRRALKAVK
jgi:hypothetical protein